MGLHANCDKCFKVLKIDRGIVYCEHCYSLLEGEITELVEEKILVENKLEEAHLDNVNHKSVIADLHRRIVDLNIVIEEQNNLLKEGV